MTSATAPAQPPAERPKREVVVDDALAFLRSHNGGDFSGCSMVSSIPDVSETGMAFPAWLRWFADSARLLLEKTPKDGLLVLTQTDIRKDGRWIDKGFLVQQALQETDAILIARKVVCRRPTGSTSSARAAFTHLLCFSRGILIEGARPDTVPDVFDGGNISWTRGLGERASLACVDLVVRYAPQSRTVVDPFCGEGMVLAAANHRGLNALGCERNSKRAEKARRLLLRQTLTEEASTTSTSSKRDDEDET